MLDGEGNIIVVDYYNDCIVLFLKNGEFLRNIVSLEDGFYYL